MNSRQHNTFTFIDNKNRNQDIRTIVNRYLYHWPLYVVLLILSMCAAYIYLQIAKPVYGVKATLLIDDRKKVPDQQSALHEIEFAGPSKIVENEIEILKSTRLIGKVVQDLQLSVVYQQKKKLLYRDLYISSPVKLTVLNATGDFENQEINVVIKDDKSFFIKNSLGELKEYPFNKTFINNLGKWTIAPTYNLKHFIGKTIKIKMLDPDIVTLQYQKLIGASLLNKLASTIVISIDDEIPQRGKDILNQLILNYNLAAAAEKNKETKATIDFLDQRLASLNVDLTDAEKQVQQFKSGRGLTDISAESKVNLENMQVNDNRLNEVNIQLNTIENIEKYINSSQNTDKTPSTLGVNDPTLNNLIEKLSQLQLEREKLLATTPETNPDFEPINRQITITKAAIKENIINIKSTLQSTKTKLQAFNSQFETSIKDIPVQERQYVSIKRQQSSKENLYTYLLQKREEASVSYASTVANDHVVDQAYSGPIKSPKKNLTYAIAFLLGIVFPSGIIYSRSYWRNKINDLQAIKDVTDIPVITELPRKQPHESKIFSKNATNAVSEQFRSLRTKLYYLYGEQESGRVTLLTSSISGEGKSFVSSNLAIALAYAGRKTVIVELDLRKPQIAETFKLPKDNLGVSDFLYGKAELSDIIQKSDLIDSLHIVSCGIATNDASELLEKQKLSDLITDLKALYDDVIIDSPPAHLVPDAMILSRVADATLYIIRQGFTPKTEIEFIKELYAQKLFQNLNIVFNGIEKKYGYGYSYDNSYYNQSKPKLSVLHQSREFFFNRF